MRGWHGFVAAAAGVGILAGLALGGLLRGDATPDALSAPGSGAAAPGAERGLADQLAALRETLAAERAERISLAAEVALLRCAVEQLAPELAVEAAASPAAEPAPTAGAVAHPEATPWHDWFDESALIERGLPPQEITRLRERFEAAEMEELLLRDQAAREGWARRPRLFEELRQIRMGLRQEIGNDSYDLMLYATGRNNRVILTDVLATSPALEAGLQSGDVILRYGGQRVFSASDLRRQTREDKAGATVALDVMRDGEELRVYLPRGPLGVRLRPTRRSPEAPR